MRQTGFVFAYIPESSPGRSDASHSRHECSTISALNRSYIHGGHSSECGWGGMALIVASVGTSSGNAVETQSNVETAQRPAQCSPEPVRSTGNQLSTFIRVSIKHAGRDQQ